MKFEKKIRALLGDFDPAAPPPCIDPVPEGVHRPRWSVMIPTFNCANYLRQTLESVLAQAPGPEEMQIEVIDDCSTKDDPEAVVIEIGKGRVRFLRKEKNEGAIPNFNTCIQRSKGELVHILHGDDWIAPEFYSAVELLAQSHPENDLFAARTNYVNEAGEIMSTTPPLDSGLNDSLISLAAFRDENPIQFAGIVVRRGFYEAHGGFLPGLVHTADREMWSRAVALRGGVLSNRILAYYRLFDTNDTGRLARTAENLRDHQRLYQILGQRIAGFDSKEANHGLLQRAMSQRAFFIKSGDAEAAKANEDFWRQNATTNDWIKRAWRSGLGRLT